MQWVGKNEERKMVQQRMEGRRDGGKEGTREGGMEGWREGGK